MSSLAVQLQCSPFQTQGHQRLWDVLAAQVENETGLPTKALGKNAWGDAAVFQEAGIPTLMLGARGDHFHAPDEWVLVSELVKFVQILERTAQQFCQ